MKKMLLQYDWDVIAGVLAAVVALVLHFLHIAESEVVLAIMLALIALLLLRDLRSEGRSHRLAEVVERVNGRLLEIQQALVPPDALLIGPQRLLQEFERFAVDAQGDLTWYASVRRRTGAEFMPNRRGRVIWRVGLAGASQVDRRE
jgi:hypothetical protein